MKRRTRTHLMLLGMVLLLSAAAVAELKREEWLTGRPIAALDAHAVHAVAVTCDGCRARRFEKLQGRWWMREPYAMAADVDAVSHLISIASAPVRKRRAATDFDPKRLGLDPPQATLEVGALKLVFGHTDAINGDRYVRVRDEVLLVPDRFSAWLYAPPEAELDRHLAPPGAGVAEVTLDGVPRADLAAAWRDAVATKVLAMPANLPEAPVREVVLRLDDGDELRWRLRRGGEGYLALRENPALAYALDEATAQRLLAPIAH